MGILDSIKDKASSAAGVVKEKYHEASDKYHELEDKETEMWKRHEDRVEAKRIAKETKLAEAEDAALERRSKREEIIAAREKAGISKKITRGMRDEADKEYSQEIYQKTTPIYKKVTDKVGGVIVTGTKAIMTDGHGRSGRRATKEWRRENRDYNSEARKARAGAVSPGVFNSITMFGQNKIPVRSRYAGANEIGTSTDPLSNWSSSILGSQSVRQDTAIEGAVRREAREYRGVREPGRQPTLSPDDALKSFAGSLGGFSKKPGKSKKGKSSGGLDGLNKMLRGF